MQLHPPFSSLQLRPGDIAVLPAGMYHAVRNMTTCLSYHRMHLDQLNFHRLYHSFVTKDTQRAHGIPHRRILWNATHGIIDTLDGDLVLSEFEKKDAIRSLCALHQCVAGMQLVDLHYRGSAQSGYDWLSLMRDITACYMTHVEGQLPDNSMDSNLAKQSTGDSAPQAFSNNQS